MVEDKQLDQIRGSTPAELSIIALTIWPILTVEAEAAITGVGCYSKEAPDHSCRAKTKSDQYQIWDLRRLQRYPSASPIFSELYVN